VITTWQTGGFVREDRDLLLSAELTYDDRIWKDMQALSRSYSLKCEITRTFKNILFDSDD
jgi:hypothetical protein